MTDHRTPSPDPPTPNSQHPSPLPYNRPDVDEDAIAEVVDTLRSGWLTTGPKAARFEHEFATYTGAAHALAVNSATAALHLALIAAGVGPGDEVITTPLTFAACANVIVQQGATPVLADVCAADLNIDPEQIERRITPRTRALMAVHYAGQPCRMDDLLDIARRHDLFLIEDAAHAAGAMYRGRMIGSIGDATAFSFYATKNLTTGEGGMLTTNRADVEERARIMTLHGMNRDAWKRYDFGRESAGSLTASPARPGDSPRRYNPGRESAGSARPTSRGPGDQGDAPDTPDRAGEGRGRDGDARAGGRGAWYYEVVAAGYKYNMSDIQAALGLSGLRRLDAMNARRAMLAARLTDRLADCDAVETPSSRAEVLHAWHLYVIRMRPDALRIDRAAFIEELTRRGIGTSVHFIPIHYHPFYREGFGFRTGDYPVAEDAYARLISLPLYPTMTEEDIDRVAGAVREVALTFRR